MGANSTASASLVVGGTGMLADATRWLAARSGTTLVAARRATRFAAGEATFVPLDVDWNDVAFRRALEEAAAPLPPFDRALLWLHAPEALLPRLLPSLGHARIVLVLGSRHAVPDVPPEVKVRLAIVRLGSVPTETGRRWLTHQEIGAGAIQALRDGRTRTVGEWPVPAT